MMRLLAPVIMLFCSVLISACKQEPAPDDYRQAMRDFVFALRTHADTITPNFLLIPQNGEELVTLGDGYDTPPAEAYLTAIDGQGREDLLYGYSNDNLPTPEVDKTFMRGHLVVAEEHGVEALVTDYCWDVTYMADSYQENEIWGFTSFSAPSRNLEVIPDYPDVPHNKNGNNIVALGDVKNFLYLLDPVLFANRSAYIAALDATAYDLFIIDAFSLLSKLGQGLS